jgi:CDGSH-type Zn-finger protein
VTNIIKTRVDGPLEVEGDVDLVDSTGDTIASTPRVRLCRCGQSTRKPYCDNTHASNGFSDESMVQRDYVIKAPQPGTPDETLRLTFRRNGPINCFGTMSILAADGSTWSGDQANLCRCGQSKNKPFCDGSHRDAGFEAP